MALNAASSATAKNSRTSLGRVGESLAEQYLTENGYQIIEKNFRCSDGEIDLIAQDGNTLTFIEVKTRRTTTFGQPEEAVTLSKQQRLGKIASHYLKTHHITKAPCRFDVIAIFLKKDLAPQIKHIRNAFMLQE